MTEHLPAALMVVLVGIAVYTDVRSEKIPNQLTAPFAIAGLVVSVALHGVDGLLSSLEGLGVGLAVFLLSSLFGRLLGGGDIKLLMAIGAIQGPLFLVWTAVYMALVGGVLAIGVSVARKDFLASLRRLGGGLMMRLFARTPLDVKDAKPAGRLPYAIPIAIGSIVAQVLCYVNNGSPVFPLGG